MCTIFCAIAIAKEKQRAWQTGKLSNFQSTTGGTVVVPVAGILVAKDIQAWVYFVTTDSIDYQFGIRANQPLNLTVNANIKFAIEKSNVFVIDDDGKEWQLAVLKKTARELQ